MVVWLILGSVILIISLFMNQKWINFLIATGVFAVYFNPINQNIFLYLIFLIGVGLLFAELYIPDFGIIGIVGLVMMVYALFQKVQDLSQLILLSLCILIAIVVTIFIGVSLGKEIKLSPIFVLNTTLNHQSGYVPVKSKEAKLNDIAIVEETLRPVGKIKLQAMNYFIEAISQEGQINSGEMVYISKIEGSTYYVRKLNEQ